MKVTTHMFLTATMDDLYILDQVKAQETPTQESTYMQCEEIKTRIQGLCA